MEIWTPVVGEMLVVKIEPMNRHDIHAVADTEFVGHVPYNLAPRMSAMRENKAFAEITGPKELAMVWKSHVSIWT